MARAGSRNRIGALAQAVMVGGAWAVFVAAWVHVVRITSRELMLFTAATVAILLVTVVAATSLWVAHNVRIYKRKGPRRAVRAVGFVADRDFLGQRLVADWGQIAGARVVRVVVTGKEKLFVAEAQPETATDALTPVRAS